MGKRQVIHLPGLAHGAPIPSGVRIGNMVFSSGISGRDQETNALPSDPAEQARNLFDNVRAFMAIAGGTTDDIAYMKVFLKDDQYRGAINREWLSMFPDEGDRPARHALVEDLRGGMLFQVEIIAVL